MKDREKVFKIAQRINEMSKNTKRIRRRKTEY